jgi:hypothetical protein
LTVIDGFLLDVGTCKEGILLWVKECGTGKVYDIIALYKPALYLLPRRGGSAAAPADVGRDLESLDLVAEARVVQRYVHVDDASQTPLGSWSTC